MIILWIRKNKADKQNIIDKKEVSRFQEHDDIMKRFRLAHPDITIQNPCDFLTEEGNPLQPIQDVKLWANIQN